MEIGQEFQTAVSLHKAGKLEAASDLIEKIIEAADPNADFYHLAALIKKSQHDFSNSEKFFKKSLEIIPKQPVVISNFANLLKIMNRLKEANQLYISACKIMPSFFDAWLNRAHLCLETNDYETAENCLLEALKLKADASVALKLMNLYMMTSQYRKLLIESQSFIKRYSSNTQGYINHSRALASLDSTEVALKFLEQAKELVDESAEIEHEIGLINYELGKFDQAKNNLNKAVSQAPEFINAHRTLNELYFQSNDDEFLSSYKNAIQRKPDSELLFHNLAAAESSSGDVESAIKTLEIALKKIGKTAYLQHGLGALYVRMKEYEKAESLFNDALELQPNNVRFLLDQISLFIKQSNYDCQNLLDRAFNLHKFNQETWAYQGLLWRLLKDERYQWLYNYGSFLKELELPTPSSHSSSQLFMKDLNEYLGTLHVSHKQPLDQSVQGGTQTMGVLFDDLHKLVSDFKNSLRESVTDYLSSLYYDSEHPFLSRLGDDFRFSGSWSVKLKKSGHHNNHVHPFGWLSCCSYISLPDTSEKEGCIKFGETSLQLGEKEETARFIKPAVGKCVFFPSYFWHGTVPFSSDSSRVTIPCDIDPVLFMK
ncbi:MAG: hypothetical protein CMK41_06320 [Porticoccaceae bacterium]|nr:hypothetical protein [Porticoccaceae bacterium]